MPTSLKGDLLSQRLFQSWRSALEGKKGKEKKKEKSNLSYFLSCGWRRAFPRVSDMSRLGGRLERVGTRPELACWRMFVVSS